MKKLSLILFAICTFVHGVDFYISPNGKDVNPGSKSKPFAKLEQARDAIRALAEADKAKGLTVWLAEGVYVLDKTFELGTRDSGTKDGRIVYRAMPGAKVTVMGGIPISPAAFKIVTDKAVVSRLFESARGKVLQYNLRAKGIKDTGTTTSRVENELVKGAMFSMRSPVPELFFNNKPLPFSKWPNTGWAKYGKVIDKGSVPRFGDKSNRPGTLEYTGTRPDRWTKAGAAAAEFHNGFNSPPANARNSIHGNSLMLSGGAGSGVEQAISGLSANTEYFLSGYAKHDGNARVVFSVQQNQRVMGETDSSTVKLGKGQTWRFVHLPFRTGPDQTSATVAITKKGAGKVYVDDTGVVPAMFYGKK